MRLGVEAVLMTLILPESGEIGERWQAGQLYRESWRQGLSGNCKESGSAQKTVKKGSGR